MATTKNEEVQLSQQLLLKKFRKAKAHRTPAKKESTMKNDTRHEFVHQRQMVIAVKHKHNDDDFGLGRLFCDFNGR